MNSPLRLFVLLLGLVPTLLRAAEADFPLVPAQECRPRGGWPNFLAKANTPGAEVRIAYFGGSITAQAGWRPKSLAFFQREFPQAKFAEINAAIGGTGSDLGVHHADAGYAPESSDRAAHRGWLRRTDGRAAWHAGRTESGALCRG